MTKMKVRIRKMSYLMRGGDSLLGIEDEDTSRAFHLILTALLIWLVLASTIVMPFFAFRKGANYVLMGVLAAMAVASLALLRRRRKHTAALLFLCVTWTVIEFFSAFSRGVHSEAVGWSFALIILAGWLLGRQSAINFAVASGVVLFVEADLEDMGHPFPGYFPGAPIGLWAVYVLFLVMAIVPILSFLDELRRQVSALRESEEHFSSLSNAALEGIMIHEDGMILDANMAYARLFGYDHPNELIGRYAPPLLLVPESRDRVLQRLERKESGVLELTGLRKDGTTFPGEMESLPIKYRGHDAVLVATHDITERIRAEEERKNLQGQLIQAQKMEWIGRLAGSISHDFNNLLTVIIGSSEMLLDSLAADHPLREGLEEIHGAGERAAGLTQRLLAFSRKQVLRPRVLELNGLVKEMLPILKRVAGNHVKVGVTLKSEALRVYVDPLQLDSVIMNLVVNARDAMPKGGRIQIETGTSEFGKPGGSPPAPGSSFVTMAVRDRGMGMSEETKSHIFEPFFTTKEIGRGTGLGLSVTLGIVEQSGGSIDVESELDQGTTFTVYLPLAKEAAVESEKREIAPGVRGTATVLVAEDHPDVRKFTISVLKSFGYSVIEIDNPELALRVFNRERGHIDLILTDVVMPDMGGREMVAMVRSRWPHAKALFMSGYNEDAVLKSGVLESGSGFIQKPFSPNQLAAKVQEILAAPTET